MKIHTIRAHGTTTRAPLTSLGLALRLWLALVLLVLSLRAALDDPEEPAPDLFDIETARHNEAQRRLRMLGELAGRDYDYRAFRERSRAALIPMPMLKAWHEAYKARGIGGLLPDWELLFESSRDSALRYRSLLGELADAESVSDEDIEQLAAKLDWRVPRTREWVVRYRRGGLWALAPEMNPYSDRVRQKEYTTQAPRMPGSLTEKDLKEIERKTVRLGWLLERLHVSDDDVEKRAEEAGCSPRILWRDLKRYRRFNVYGLTRFGRSDNGGRHDDDWYTKVIVACRLTKRDATINWIYNEVCERARRRGLPEPTYWRIRTVCGAIKRDVKQIADGREDEFRNSSRFAGMLKINGVVYEIDHTLVDVLVRDLRQPKYRTKSGLVRPYITLVIEEGSRTIVAAIFSYDRPDRFTVAEAIRQALTINDGHLYGGIPGEIKIDQGEEFKSKHVNTICWSFGIKLTVTYIPEHKPYVERFFRTLSTRLWATLQGYTGSSVEERNPKAEEEACLNIADIEAKFWEFIHEKYHKEIHSELGVTPLQFWDENCFTEAADPRKLDVLMMEPQPCKITKGRFSLDGRLYIHPDFATIVGEHVLARRPIHYGSPDTIEVFQDGNWIRTAVAIDSELADAITAEDVREAQKAQRKAASTEIDKAKQVIADDDKEFVPPKESQGGQAQDGKVAAQAEDTTDASADTNAVRDVADLPEEDFLESLGRQAKQDKEAKRAK